MLNDSLNQLQSKDIEIRDSGAQVRKTVIARGSSANSGAKELAKQRFQRMRRRHERAIRSASAVTGWVARMA